MEAARPEPDVRPVDVEVVRGLRRRILRPFQPAAASAYPGDEAPEALHLAVRAEGRVVAVGTILHQAPEGEDDPAAWRIRGMATVPVARGGGLGRAVLDRLLEHAESRDGRLVWCNARVRAAPFYERAGFSRRGGLLHFPGIGPHFFMWRDLPRDGLGSEG
ncbi:MAG: GNAT family N-acetyltransferase [Actinobacteria bacterium]|nr:GNAT family N-acetyltransferase [Actinomycetota bacterium]